MAISNPMTRGIGSHSTTALEAARMRQEPRSANEMARAALASIVDALPPGGKCYRHTAGAFRFPWKVVRTSVLNGTTVPASHEIIRFESKMNGLYSELVVPMKDQDEADAKALMAFIEKLPEFRNGEIVDATVEHNKASEDRVTQYLAEMEADPVFKQKVEARLASRKIKGFAETLPPEEPKQAKPEKIQPIA